MKSNKNLSIKAYGKYMNVVNSVIKETESRVKSLPDHKKMQRLSYQEWVVFQKGETKLSQIGV